ncbi:hypothetical protein M407DRAFT_28919, partial [Tulasnella calospora MUT 4182]
LPFPSLKRLHVGKSYTAPSPPQVASYLRIDLDAPQLYQLSYYFHAILPPALSRLTRLSISKSDFRSIEPPIIQNQIELPELLELQIAKCEPGPILCALSTPALQVLIFYSEFTSDEPPEELPEYPHLRDLQWSDVGGDPTFNLVFRHCPNLTRYANYVVEREKKVYHGMTDGPTIFHGPGRMNSIEWPRLEEVLFDCASCVDLLALMDLVPTIKRIRILKDPCEFGDVNVEKERLVELREKVEVALWLDAWTDV